MGLHPEWVRIQLFDAVDEVAAQAYHVAGRAATEFDVAAPALAAISNRADQLLVTKGTPTQLPAARRCAQPGT
jgi:hypothetical protein